MASGDRGLATMDWPLWGEGAAPHGPVGAHPKARRYTGASNVLPSGLSGLSGRGTASKKIAPSFLRRLQVGSHPAIIEDA